MSKTIVIYVKFLRGVACQKLLTSANVSRSYSKNNTGTLFLRHGVLKLCLFVICLYSEYDFIINIRYLGVTLNSLRIVLLIIYSKSIYQYYIVDIIDYNCVNISK